MRDLIVLFKLARKERKRVLEWLRVEWEEYANQKQDDYRPAHDVTLAREGIGPGTWWESEVLRYMKRADVLGLNTPLGRQAACKGMAVYVDMCAAIVRVYGDPPPAGVPSGELR